MKRILLTVLIAVIVLLAIPLIVLATGMIDIGATNDPGTFEKKLATYAMQRSVAVRAPDQSNPFAGDQQAIDTGMGHYISMCVRCHGGSGMKPDEFAQGLNPPAPKLDQAVEEFTEGELFWITKHGIRMTGMPAFGKTHNDEDIWKIVAYLTEMPKTSSQQESSAAGGHPESTGR